MKDRSKQLAEDLKQTPFALTYDQKTILNHYVRTPVAIIQGIVENLEDSEDAIGYETIPSIKKELDEIVKVVQLINGCN